MSPVLQAAAIRQYYKKTSGCVTIKGQMYEIKLAALLFARASNRGYKFSLATNVEGAGSFDDILFRYQQEADAAWRNTFIQMKHTPNVHLNLNKFLGEQGDFALKTYHTSFSAIKKKLNADSDDALFKGTIENCDFIIFTTAKLDEKLQTRERVYAPGPIGELIETKTEHNSIFSFCEQVDDDVYDDLDRHNFDSMRYFLRSLKLFTAQPREEELDKYLVEEIRTKFKVPKIHATLICQHYVDDFKNWWSNRHFILDETSEILNDSFNKYKVTALTVKEVDNYFRKDVTFLDTIGLDQLICHGTSFLNVVVYFDHCMNVTCNKLLQVVDFHYDTYTFVSMQSLRRVDNRHAVLSHWSCARNKLLVVVCDADMHNDDAVLSNEICNILSQKESGKKFIALSCPGNSFVESLRKELGENFCSEFQNKSYPWHDENEMLSSGDSSQSY